MAAGKEFNLQPGHTSSIRRIEGGMIPYHADMDISTNPFELGLDRLISLGMDADFIGKSALRKISEEGVKRKQIGLVIECEPLKAPNTTFWIVEKNGKQVGKVTSAVYSPRLKQNIALAMMSCDHTNIGMSFDVNTPSGLVSAISVEKPFFDPKKKIAALREVA